MMDQMPFKFKNKKCIGKETKDCHDPTKKSLSLSNQKQYLLSLILKI